MTSAGEVVRPLFKILDAVCLIYWSGEKTLNNRVLEEY